jgi:hypothetical protein
MREAHAFAIRSLAFRRPTQDHRHGLLRKGHSQVIDFKAFRRLATFQALGASGKRGDAMYRPMLPRLQEGPFPPQQSAFCAAR